MEFFLSPILWSLFGTHLKRAEENGFDQSNRIDCCEAVFEVNGDGVEILKVKTFPHLTINELLEPCPGSDFEASSGEGGVWGPTKMGGKSVGFVRKNSCLGTLGWIFFLLVFRAQIFLVGIQKTEENQEKMVLGREDLCSYFWAKGSRLGCKVGPYYL